MKSIQLLAIPLTLAIFATVGFGQEPETKTSKAKKNEANLSKAAKRLHGIWVGDVDSTAKEIEKQDAEIDEGMIEELLARVETIEIKLTDGEFDVQIGDREMAGEWKAKKLKRKDKTRILTVHFTPDTADEEKTFDIHFMGKTHMKMVDVGEEASPPIVLKRKDAAKKKSKDKTDKAKDKADEDDKADKSKDDKDKS